MTCRCGKFAHDPECTRPEHSARTLEVSTPAAYEERIRLLEDVLRRLAPPKTWVCMRPDCPRCGAVRAAWELLG